MPLRIIAIVVVAAAGVAVGQKAVASETIKGRAMAISGDRLVVNGVDIWLYGLDAPEADQQCLAENGARWACGEMAKSVLQSSMHAIDVECETRGQGRFNWPLAICKVRSLDLNIQMVQIGLALADTKQSEEYVYYQDFARQMEVGMWRGAFIAPWDWREKAENPAIMSSKPARKKARAKLLEYHRAR